MAEDWNSWNENNMRIIAEFRANRGKVEGEHGGLPMLVLTTTGVKSGLPRESPLCHVVDGEGYVIAASKGGHPQHPHWFLNLLANPDVTVEVGDEKFSAVASVPEESERRRLYDALVAEMPFSRDSKKSPPNGRFPWLYFIGRYDRGIALNQ